jgi:hypothetical protein
MYDYMRSTDTPHLIGARSKSGFAGKIKRFHVFAVLFVINHIKMQFIAGAATRVGWRSRKEEGSPWDAHID